MNVPELVRLHARGMAQARLQSPSRRSRTRQDLERKRELSVSQRRATESDQAAAPCIPTLVERGKVFAEVRVRGQEARVARSNVGFVPSPREIFRVAGRRRMGPLSRTISAVLLFSAAVLVALASTGAAASPTASASTNNWAVLVCSVRFAFPLHSLSRSNVLSHSQSRFWFNYRVSASCPPPDRHWR